MKVVCRVLHHSLTYLKEYDVIEKEDRTEYYGNFYVFEQIPYVRIKNDKGISLWYERKYFFSAQELRRRKLRRLNKIE